MFAYLFKIFQTLNEHVKPMTFGIVRGKKRINKQASGKKCNRQNKYLQFHFVSHLSFYQTWNVKISRWHGMAQSIAMA